MITNELELKLTQDRVEQFQRWLVQVRRTALPQEFEAAASGYRLEIERMQAEIMEFLLHPPIAHCEHQLLRIPKGFWLKAQGCEERLPGRSSAQQWLGAKAGATLGHAANKSVQPPKGLCLSPMEACVGSMGSTPLGLQPLLPRLTQRSPAGPGQRWALGRCPLGAEAATTGHIRLLDE
jgi:hypothetical protein